MRFIKEDDISGLPKTMICEKHGEYEVKTSPMPGGRLIVKDNCSKCAEEAEAEYQRKEAEERQKLVTKRMEASLLNAGVSKRNLWKKFDSFIVENDKQKEALNHCREIADDVINGRVAKNTFMIGSVGTGKTHLAASIIHDLVKSKSVRCIRLIDLMRKLKDSWRRDSDYTETEAINYYANLDLLIIDEVGIQFGSDAEKMFMFDIINGRYENMKPTILISNLNLSNLKENLGEQVIDRLREDGGKVLVFDWESKRK